ncbi:MAG: hypothetical protein ACO307_17055, partial [Ilumatobacteraceae bacterium]
MDQLPTVGPATVRSIADGIAITVQHVASRWLRGRGLLAEIETARGADDERCPAPGLEASETTIRAATERAIEIGLWTSTFEPDDRRTDEDFADLVPLATEAVEIARVIDVEHRRLAQLLLGINARSADLDRVDLTDRAATSIIAAGVADGHTLPTDEHRADATDLDEFEVELAGVVSRMILEQNWSIFLLTARGEPRVIRWDVDGVAVVTRAGSRRWSDPMVVVEVVAEAIEGADWPLTTTILPTDTDTDADTDDDTDADTDPL